MSEIILASKSKIRLEILKKNRINCKSQPSNIDEDEIKYSMIKQGASPEDISKSLAELKANKISQKNPEKVVIGADSVIDFENEIMKIIFFLGSTILMLLFAPKDLDFTRNIKSTFLTLNIRGGLKSPS